MNGHFENLFEEAGRLLSIIGVDDYVKFPEYRPSKTQPYMQEYYSELIIPQARYRSCMKSLSWTLNCLDTTGFLVLWKS